MSNNNPLFYNGDSKRQERSAATKAGDACLHMWRSAFCLLSITAEFAVSGSGRKLMSYKQKGEGSPVVNTSNPGP